MSTPSTPQPPGIIVHRARLCRLFDTAVQRPVTVLCAPAGWGKTTALTSWLHGDSVTDRVVWMALNESVFATTQAFWQCLGARLAAAGCDARLSGDLSSQQLYPAEPVLVVLDDFHLVEDSNVLPGLDRLVRRSGGAIRLLISTRTDPAPPLHRWRLEDGVSEVRSDELAFTVDETADMMAGHDVVLSPPEVEAVHSRTEGWPAGLRFAALSLQSQGDAPRHVDPLAEEESRVAQFFQAEVLAGQPPERMQLLLRTGVVGQVCGELADALTGATNGERDLAELMRTNAFVVPLGGRPAWYRYHRQFSASLQAELRRSFPTLIPQLHLRATFWLAAHGMPVDATRHALAAGDAGLASTLVGDHWAALALCGQHVTLPDGHVPPADEPPLDGAELTLAHVVDRLVVGDLQGADAALRHAVHAGAEAIAAVRLARARLSGEVAGVASSASALLDLVERIEMESPEVDGDPRHTHLRAVAATALGAAQLAAGDIDAARDQLTDLPPGPPCVRRTAAGASALLLAIEGDLRHAERAALATMRMPPCEGQPHDIHGEAAYLALALVNHEWDRSVEARRFLDLAVRARRLAAEPGFAAWEALIRSWHLRAAGDLWRAMDVLQDGRRGEDPLGAVTALPVRLERWFVASEAELRIAHGDARIARAMVAPTLDKAGESCAPLAVALARACLHDGDPHAAMRALPPWSNESKAEPLLSIRLAAGLVEAQVARLLGDPRRAATTLERVLELAEPHGHRRVFTMDGGLLRDLLADQMEQGTAYWSMVSRLSDAASRDAVAGSTLAGGEPLTEREVTVLRYLQSVLSNEEIAAKLFVSVNTVKTHIRHIYRKLGVGHRRDAVRRARELRVL